MKISLGAHGVDGDQGAGEFEALQQQRDGGDLVRLGRGRFLDQHQSLTRRPGRDIPSVTLRINVSPTQAVMQAWCRTSISGGDGRKNGVPQGVASVPAALAAKQ